MTATFTSKLDSIIDTVVLAAGSDHNRLATALRTASGIPVLVVGSGGSSIAAEFLAACRTGLGHAPTVVVTPMSYVLEKGRPPSTPAWFFSASGENPDILAAFKTAIVDGAAHVDVVTSGAGGALARAAANLAGRRPTPSVHICPVADPKDGFLATHSVVSACASIVLAADAVAGSPSLRDRQASLLDAAGGHLAHDARTRLRNVEFAEFADRDTLLLLHDPSLTAAAVLIETSFWEAGIGAVQRTDFRNFAHGRHVWLSRHPGRTFVLALTCGGSETYWNAIRSEIPANIPSAHLDFGPSGRGNLFEAVVAALCVVEAAGATKGIDPGRPGVADFGRRIFERDDLLAHGRKEDPSTRRKARAEVRVDATGRETTDWTRQRERFLTELAAAEFRAIVLDYDGTVVTTPERLEPPRCEILAALRRLSDAGLHLGFATGRGGSVGEMLRLHLPKKMHREILVGYYNGAHIVSLDVDIGEHPPKADPAIGAFHDALCAERDLFVGDWRPKAGTLQITIPFAKLASPADAFERLVQLLGSVSWGFGPTPWMTRSAHSVDIVSHGAGKLRVVEEAKRRVGDRLAGVLCIGDSGDCQGNDHDLLEGPLGLSVDAVCHRHDACWNLLPAEMAGPDGLMRILNAISLSEKGTARLDVSALFTN
jgi:hypothetical protein